MKIAVLMLATPNCTWAEFSAKNAESYCAKYGYDFIFKTELLDPTVSAYWNKILWLAKILPDYDAVYQMDADTSFTGHHPLDGFVTDGVASSEMNGICTFGNTMFASTLQVQQFLDNLISSTNADETTKDGPIVHAALNKSGAPSVFLYPRHILCAFLFYYCGHRCSNVNDETVAIHWPRHLRKENWTDLMKELSN